MYLHKSRGFTLIELLVVIAIIGILSAVVLASLSTARNKANDASVKGNLHTLKTQATLFYGDNGNSYGTFDDGSGGTATCPATGTADASLFGNATVENAIASAISYTPVGGVAMCYASQTVYTAAVSRPSSSSWTPPSVYWCVDSSGQSCGINDLPLGDAICSCVTTE